MRRILIPVIVLFCIGLGVAIYQRSQKSEPTTDVPVTLPATTTTTSLPEEELSKSLPEEKSSHSGTTVLPKAGPSSEPAPLDPETVEKNNNKLQKICDADELLKEIRAADSLSNKGRIQKFRSERRLAQRLKDCFDQMPGLVGHPPNKNKDLLADPRFQKAIQELDLSAVDYLRENRGRFDCAWFNGRYRCRPQEDALYSFAGSQDMVLFLLSLNLDLDFCYRDRDTCEAPGQDLAPLTDRLSDVQDGLEKLTPYMPAPEMSLAILKHLNEYRKMLERDPYEFDPEYTFLYIDGLERFRSDLMKITYSLPPPVTQKEGKPRARE